MRFLAKYSTSVEFYLNSVQLDTCPVVTFVMYRPYFNYIRACYIMTTVTFCKIRNMGFVNLVLHVSPRG